MDHSIFDVLKALAVAEAQLKDINEQHKTASDSLKDSIEQLSIEAIRLMDLEEVPSVRVAGKNWTPYDHVSYRVDSVADLRDYIVANPEHIHLLQGRIASNTAKAFITEHEVPPPGVSTFTRRKIKSRSI